MPHMDQSLNGACPQGARLASGDAVSSEEVAGQSPKRTVNQQHSVLGRPEGASLCLPQGPPQTPMLERQGHLEGRVWLSRVVNWKGIINVC